MLPSHLSNQRIRPEQQMVMDPEGTRPVECLKYFSLPIFSSKPWLPRAFMEIV